MRNSTAAMTATIALAGLAASAVPVLADGCEVWKDREHRCSWVTDSPGSRTFGQSLNAKLVLGNKTAAPVEVTINHWVSLCGVAGKHRSEAKVSVPAGETHWKDVQDDPIRGPDRLWLGKLCTEVFVSCGAAKCADVLTFEQR